MTIPLICIPFEILAFIIALSRGIYDKNNYWKAAAITVPLGILCASFITNVVAMTFCFIIFPVVFQTIAYYAIENYERNNSTNSTDSTTQELNKLIEDLRTQYENKKELENSINEKFVSDSNNKSYENLIELYDTELDEFLAIPASYYIGIALLRNQGLETSANLYQSEYACIISLKNDVMEYIKYIAQNDGDTLSAKTMEKGTDSVFLPLVADTAYDYLNNDKYYLHGSFYFGGEKLYDLAIRSLDILHDKFKMSDETYNNNKKLLDELVNEMFTH